MTYYSMLDITPITNKWMKAYEEVTAPLVKEYGGEYIIRTRDHERLEGFPVTEEPAVRIVIKWPSKEAALGFMEDERYLPHLKARANGSLSNHFLVKGL